MRLLIIGIALLMANSLQAAGMAKCDVVIRSQHWKLEKAVTLEERRTGLMLRKKIKPHTGMLFLLPEPAETGMWMKDTLVPLDMVFIDEDERIAYIEHNAEPQSLEPITPEGMMIAVIEMPGGESKRARLEVGDKVNLKRCY